MDGDEAVRWGDLSLRDRLTSLPREARLMLVGVGLFSLGNGLTMPYLFVYLHDVRSISTTMVGLVVAWMAVVGLGSAPLWGVAIDRLGPRAALQSALVTEVVGVASIAWVTDLWQAFLVATVVAAGAAGAWPAQSALLARLVPTSHRTWLFGLQFMLLNLGIGIGGLVAATFIDVDRPGTFQALYLVDALGYLAYVAMLRLMPRDAGLVAVDAEPEADTGDGAGAVGYGPVLRDRVLLQLLLTAVVLILFGYAQLQVGLTAYATQVADLPARWLGVAFAANTGTIVVAQLVVIRRLEGRSRSRALGVVGLLWASSWLVLLVAGAATSVLVAVIAVAAATTVFALGEMVWSPTFPALVNDLAPDALRGRYNALAGIAWNVGNVLGPAYAGLLLGHGLAEAWPVVTAAGCLLAGLLALRLRHHLTAAQDGRTPRGATMTA